MSINIDNGGKLLVLALTQASKTTAKSRSKRCVECNQTNPSLMSDERAGIQLENNHWSSEKVLTISVVRDAQDKSHSRRPCRTRQHVRQRSDCLSQQTLLLLLLLSSSVVQIIEVATTRTPTVKVESAQLDHIHNGERVRLDGKIVNRLNKNERDIGDGATGTDVYESTRDGFTGERLRGVTTNDHKKIVQEKGASQVPGNNIELGHDGRILGRIHLSVRQSNGHNKNEARLLFKEDGTRHMGQHAGEKRDKPSKIDRRKRSNNVPNPIKRVCSDCLAIPMVALVGRRRVNGYIVKPAPSNFHARLSSLPDETFRPADYQHNVVINAATAVSGAGKFGHSHGVRNNDNHDNGQQSPQQQYQSGNNEQMDHINHQGPPKSAASSLTTGGAVAQRHTPNMDAPTSQQAHPLIRESMVGFHGQYQTAIESSGTHTGNGSHPATSPNYHQNRVYAYQPPAVEMVAASLPTNRPFEPKSDEKCPMVGPITVCDQINSYPADAILHKLESLEQALHKSYFNVDSLFSDESDGLSDPFETPPAQMRAQSGGHQIERHGRHKGPASNYSATDSDYIPENYSHKYLMHQHDDSQPGKYRKSANTETSTFAKKSIAPSNTSAKSLGGGQQWRQIGNNNGQSTRAEIVSTRSSKSENNQKQDFTIEEVYADKARRETELGTHRPGGNARAQIQAFAIAQPLENLLTPADKFLYLVERRGLNGVSGTIHNLEPGSGLANARQIMDNRARGGTHEIEAAKFSENFHDEAFQNTDHRDKPSGQGSELSATPASLASVASGTKRKVAGGEIGGGHLRCRRAANGRDHEQPNSASSTSIGTSVASTVDAGRPHASKWPISDDNTADLARPTHASVNDGYGVVAASRAEPSTLRTQQTSAGALDNGPGKNNLENGLRQHQRHSKQQLQRSSRSHDASRSTKDAVSLSAPLLTVSGKRDDSGANARVADQIKVQTPMELSSAGPRVRWPNLLLSSLEATAPIVAGVAVAAEPKSLTAGLMNRASRSAAHHDNAVESGQAAAGGTRVGTKRDGTGGRASAGGHYGTTVRITTTAATLKRSIRQAGIPAEPAGAPAVASDTVDDSARRGPEAEELNPANEPSDVPSPMSNEEPDAGADQGSVPQPICRAKSIYISPRAALNDKKQWKYIVNAPERDSRIKQIIRVDVCEAPFEACSGDVTVPLGFTSQCKQKYAKKKLLALDSQSGLLEVDTFFIPSCCVCQLITDRGASTADESL